MSRTAPRRSHPASVGDLSPRARIEAACASHGRSAVVSACLDLLADRRVEPWALDVLRGHAGEGSPYFRRVWALRGLRWAWDEAALPALLASFADEAWRVREMAAKVVAHNLVAGAFDEVVRAQGDPVPRVRVAASRAVMRLTAAGV